VEGQAVVLCTLQLVVQDIDDIGPVIPGLHAVLDFFEVARPELARAHLRGRRVARTGARSHWWLCCHDAANHEASGLDGVGRPGGKVFAPQVHGMAIAALHATRIFGRPALTPQVGIHAGIVMVLHDGHVQLHRRLVVDGPSSSGGPGLGPHVGAANQNLWHILKLVVALSRVDEHVLLDGGWRIPTNAQTRTPGQPPRRLAPWPHSQAILARDATLEMDVIVIGLRIDVVANIKRLLIASPLLVLPRQVAQACREVLCEVALLLAEEFEASSHRQKAQSGSG